MDDVKGFFRFIINSPKYSGQDLKDYWVNEGPKAIFVVGWLLINAGLMVERAVHYANLSPGPYDVFGGALIAARASAVAIKFNMGLLLIPVLRNFLSYLRGTVVGTYLPIDKSIVFHRRIAWMIAFLTIVHATAHYVNYNTTENYPNIIEYKDRTGFKGNSLPTTWESAWTTLAGTTGHLAVLVMILIYTSAMESVRRPYFEAFWFTHHLFVIWFGLLVAHGAMSNLETTTVWAWIAGPLLVYLIERLVRLVRGNQNTILQKLVGHPSRVLELRMKKSSFKFEAAQYLFLNCPYISRNEWHPFTISSAPEEDFVSVHIRVVGDWTGKMEKLFNPERNLGVVAENVLTAPNGMPILRIDGPFGTASTDIFKFETVMLIGAGIGVTPFASILKTIRFRLEAALQDGGVGSSDGRLRSAAPISVTKVYFYHIVREKNAFEWFFEVLVALENDNVNNFLEIHTYLTSVKSLDEARRLVGEDDAAVFGDRDPVTGLRTPAHYGRPNFDEIFRTVADLHPEEHVGVFFCGPHSLSKQLYGFARRQSRATTTKFHYHKENF
ncbi:cytochrome b245 heavy chain, putative [Acanthamoeba castellanii str. Neff]|uniref:Cytochrome b245 heavy chain, putative n=1 Tax=Acanthamoeba castellanii (strain ATCC 30010 / Neff) TaxID=1257118 RepID=L8GYB8_ACACF|nr:cytochrome b245 heavy chain, putative [Acanthamoeba castellanii str. Neff]ELR18264.1 cytochrome b245 heavy chain, putative [Acanthamoeba castellanii str. Neff]